MGAGQVKLELQLCQYQEDDDATEPMVSPYQENEEPTLRSCLSPSDCIALSQQATDHVVEGFYLLMAAGLLEGGV
jgi:hypothetical protein